MADIQTLIRDAQRCKVALFAEVPSVVANHVAAIIEALCDAVQVPSAWRGELPTQPGWYAFKYPRSGNIWCIFVALRAGILMVERDNDADYIPLTQHTQGQWKGPLDFEAL